MCAMGAILFKDLPPYVTCSGNPAAPHGINSEGLKRRAYSPGQIENVRRAYKTLYKGGLLLEEARRELAALGALHSEVEVLSEFVAASTRGIMR
jgi:UDP-N-acetylglucosamine acyltransferase